MFKEIKYIFNALSFLTRIPCYDLADFTEKGFQKSVKYYSLVGLFIGLLAASIYILCKLILPESIAILISIIITIALTGAFHEDGLADTFDAFGATSDKEKILSIMKDSRLGTYGVIALISGLSLKYVMLANLSELLIIKSLILGHSLSRYCAISVMFNNKYSRINDDSGKSSSVIKNLSKNDLILLTLFGLLPFILFDLRYYLIIIPVLLVKFLLIRYFNKRIDGYTGDCLGTIQQLTELTTYLSILVIYLWKYF